MTQGTAGLDEHNTRGDDSGSSSDDLVVIRQQTRETVQLLRQLIDMLLPKGDPDKPKLEDLIAALVSQQARTIMLIQQIAADLDSLHQLVADDRSLPPERTNGHLRR